jgi:signal peptidase I
MSAKKKKTDDEKQKPAREPQTFMGFLREWAEALIIAYLMAMFLRVFVVELFKIPSPSMTPTLLGTEVPRHSVGYYDINDDGLKDMVLKTRHGDFITYDIYTKTEEGPYRYAGKADPDYPLLNQLDEGVRKAILEDKSIQRQIQLEGGANVLSTFVSDLWPSEKSQRRSDRIRQRQDRILVAKFVYWFSPPRRGEIAVFQTPEQVFDSTRPIYIKRVTGLPGETLSFEPTTGVPGHYDQMGRLVADGKRVETPEFFQHQRYVYRNADPHFGQNTDKVHTRRTLGGEAVIESIEVPDDSVIMMGDNTISSQDSRYWGPVELPRLRGRALFRYNLSYLPYTNEPGLLH